MSVVNSSAQRKILAFAAVVEAVTGLALIAVPVLGISLLLGANGSAESIAIARFLGIGLLGLGLACWRPGRRHSEDGSSAFRGMWTYNLLVALFLAYLGAVDHRAGLLLWPAVALHAAVTAGLAWTW